MKYYPLFKEYTVSMILKPQKDPTKKNINIHISLINSDAKYSIKYLQPNSKKNQTDHPLW